MNTNTNKGAHFGPTNLSILNEGKGFPYPVVVPSSEALAWDAPDTRTNCAIYVERYDSFSYAELRITGRRVRCHTGGVWGYSARVRYDGEDWRSCVVVVS